MKPLSQHASLQQEESHLEKIITAAQNKLSTEIKLLESRCQELQSKAAQIPALNKKVMALATQLQTLEATETERDQNRQNQSDLQSEKAKLSQHNLQLKEEMDIIKIRLDQLTEAESLCPICTQPLSEEHRAKVKAEFETNGTTKGDMYRANKQRLAEIKDEDKTLQKRIKTASKELGQQRKLQNSHAQAQTALAEAQKAQAEYPAQVQALKSHQKQLQDNEIELEARAVLADIQAKLQSLNYNSQAHTALRQSIKDLNHFADDWRSLQTALEQAPQETARLKSDQAQLDTLLASTATDRQTIATLTAETAALPKLDQEMNQVNQQVDQLTDKLSQARREEAAAQQMLTHIAQQAKRRGEMEDELTELRQSQSLYQELRTAFGKKGVQALLIEHAIPELEDEANAILGRMTDGRMHLRFITQKQTKSTDNTIENLRH